MDTKRVCLCSFTAKELELYSRDPSTRPAHLSSQTVEALMLGHPLTHMPKEAFRLSDDGNAAKQISPLSQLGHSLLRLTWRILLPFTLALVSCTFLFRFYVHAVKPDKWILHVRNQRFVIDFYCEIFTILPSETLCYGGTVLTCLFLAAMAWLSKLLAIRVTDFIAGRTIAMATCHIMRRIRHLYGLLQTTDPSDIRDRNQPTSYRICCLFEAILRSRLLMLICNCMTALLCVICIFVDIKSDVLLLRWQLAIGLLHIVLLSCIFSNSLLDIRWFKAFHLITLAFSILFINKINGINKWIVNIWQLPIGFFQEARWVKVFKNMEEFYVFVLKEQNCLFNNISHVVYILIISWFLRLINFPKYLNLVQMLFRFSFLMDPVESVLFLVSLCQLPPMTSIIMLRPQLSRFTESEMHSLLLIGSVQCLLTSARPYYKTNADFIINSKVICTLTPLATVCATFISTLVNSSLKQKSTLLQHSQDMVTQRRRCSRGLRHMLVNQTRMACRLLLLLIVAHSLYDRLLYYFRMALSITLHNTSASVRTTGLTSVNFFLIGTGSYLRKSSSFFNNLITGHVPLDEVLNQELLLEDVYPRLISSPTNFIRKVKDCNVSMWHAATVNLESMLSKNLAPLLSSDIAHKIFLLLLRIMENGRQEIMVFVGLLLVNLRRREQLNLLMSLPRLAICHVIALALVFIIVNFVTSVSFF